MNGLGTRKLVYRATLLLGALFLAPASLINASSEVGESGLLTVSLVQSSLNAKALTRAAQLEYQSELMRQDGADFAYPSSRVTELAREAFLVAPLSSSSQRILALDVFASNAPDRARAAMDLVTTLSKRDAAANLWLAQQAGESGDLGKMIVLLDRSLRTSRVARGQVMRNLVGLISYPASFDLIGGMLARNPDWEKEFWAELASSDAALSQAASFMVSNRISPDRIDLRSRELLFARLQRAERFEDLYKLARLSSKTRPEGAPDGGRFRTTEEVGPFGWRFHSSGTYSTTVDGKSGALRVDVSPPSFGAIAERLVKLGDSHRLSISLDRQLPEGSLIRMTLLCATDPSRELAQVHVKGGQRSAAVSFYNGDCTFGVLSLGLDFNATQQSAILRVQRADIQPLAS